MKDKCSDGEVLCLEGNGLDFDVVADSWLGVVGRDVFGGVHSGGDVDVDGVGTVVCWRSAFKMCVVGDLYCCSVFSCMS